MLSGMNLKVSFWQAANYAAHCGPSHSWAGKLRLTSFAPEVISLFFNPVPRALFRLKKH